MVPRETVNFVRPRVLIFPETKHQDSREKKTNWFLEGPYIKRFVIYLDFLLNNHMAKANKQIKDGVRATTAQFIPVGIPLNLMSGT